MGLRLKVAIQQATIIVRCSAKPQSFARSSRVQKTKSVEPAISRNIVHLVSLSARAMQTLEERIL
jgi:hypothetical protein